MQYAEIWGVLMIEVYGPASLGGEIEVQGAKNSTLPLLAAAVICKGQTVLHNCPRLSDVETAIRILEHLGCTCRREGSDLIVDNKMTCCEIPVDLMQGMRSSIVFLGALVSRCGEANLYFPGGCEIGLRPIDLHISSLKKMGVEIEEENGCLKCSAPEGISGSYVSLAFPSVGATENLILAAVCARGTTVIANAAREPEIIDMAAYLNRCGAKIYGAGESYIIIDGVEELYGCEHTIMPDRIVAATYMSAAAVTGSDLTIHNINYKHILPMLSPFEESGCIIKQYGDSINIKAPKRLKAVKHLRTMPYPGFPTDAQPIVMPMAAVGQGTSIIVENIFENRFKYVNELNKMGANIRVEGKVAIVEGVERLQGASLVSWDLRGGAALIVAGLAAEGKTLITGEDYIERGYENITEKFTAIGAKMNKLEDK